jgi:hypothetical protein
MDSNDQIIDATPVFSLLLFSSDSSQLLVAVVFCRRGNKHFKGVEVISLPRSFEKQIRTRILKLRESWGIPLSLPIEIERIIQSLKVLDSNPHSGVQECVQKLIGKDIVDFLSSQYW